MPWCVQHMSVLYAAGNPSDWGSLSVPARKGKAAAGEPWGELPASAADRCLPHQLRLRDRAGKRAQSWARESGLVKGEERGKRLCCSWEGSDWCENSPLLAGEKAEQGYERFPAVQEEQGLPLAAVILWLAWEASADGLWFQRCEYLSGFACWNTSSDLFYSPSPVHLPAEKMSEEAKEKNAKPAHRKKKGKKVTPCTDSLL